MRAISPLMLMLSNQNAQGQIRFVKSTKPEEKEKKGGDTMRAQVARDNDESDIEMRIKELPSMVDSRLIYTLLHQVRYLMVITQGPPGPDKVPGIRN